MPKLTSLAIVAILCTLTFALGRDVGTEDALAAQGEFRCATRTLTFTLSFDRHSYKIGRVKVCADGRVTLYGKRIAANTGRG